MLSDVLILPTKLMETFPTVILEAYNYGVIPIVYYFPGVEEIIEHGQTGFIAHNLNEMAHYLELIIVNNELMIRMRESVMKLLNSSLFCVKNAVKILERLYKEGKYY